ncbi:alpha/beta fold hydrolase [Cohnella suwonensis]|uniref:Alpha/beta fold hydrolase n=1 Tax=Cohnella suwonensis TaxID=696072 RepID=A0ABW0LW67_9BACL
MPLIHVNGAELHYHLQGTGTPIVFVHPPCIGSRVFTNLRNDLSQDNRTLMFDHRGHGRSGTSRARVTIALLAEDTKRMLDALDIGQAYLCAYSLGSLVALQAMLTHPDRFVGGVLLGGLSEANGWQTRARLKIGLAAEKIGARGLISFPLSWTHADSHEAFYRLRGETRSGDMRKWREYMESALTFSATSRLKEVRQPMLLVCGQRDTEYKHYLRTLQRGLTNFSTAYVPGVKRTLPVHAAGSIGALIRSWVGAQEEERERAHVERRVSRETRGERGDEEVAGSDPFAGPFGRYREDAEAPLYH